MKNLELYNKTVDILVQAYLNDTLEHNNCYACAVGNLVTANCGYTYDKNNRSMSGRFGWAHENFYNHTTVNKTTLWASVFTTTEDGQALRKENFKGEALRQINSTGYSLKELMKIEYAFERAKFGDSRDSHMFNGLMAVIEVLDQIHENTDAAITTTVKNRFNKQLIQA